MAHGLGMHVHVSETVIGAPGVPGAVGQDAHSDSGPVRGVGLRAGSLAAHCVYAAPEDWAIMAEKHVSCVHNPWSNLKLGSGMAPVPAMVRAGVNVALGTDGMSSHNSADLFSDVKLAACLPGRGGAGTPWPCPPVQALETATVNGAEALGRDTGVIAPGKTADLILVDFYRPQPDPLPRRGGEPGLRRPRLQRGDEYGAGTGHI